MKAVDLAYIAGLTDGEGTIGITRVKERKRRVYSYYLKVSIGMTNEYLPKWLKLSFGGVLYYHVRGKYKNWKPTFDWIITGDQAGDFVKAIYSYLRIKKPQADLAREFLTVKGKYKVANGFERYHQELLWEKMSILNKRGQNGEDTSEMPSLLDDDGPGEVSGS
jgi:hypothetical protein